MAVVAAAFMFCQLHVVNVTAELSLIDAFQQTVSSTG